SRSLCLSRHYLLLLSLCILSRPPCSTLFPYTTLFRSCQRSAAGLGVGCPVPDARFPMERYPRWRDTDELDRRTRPLRSARTPGTGDPAVLARARDRP